ncbi:MAG TPA: DUF3575 domain-containing protein [Chryseosolibacter sp.]|nr:DUF3575 domain-containing protein [Chryseosolibacter sp.]
MSRYILLVASFHLLNFTLSLAQKNVVKTDILSPLRGLYNVAVERAVKKSLSVEVAVEAGRFLRGTINGRKEYELSGLAVSPKLRLFPFHKKNEAPIGFFSGIYFQYAWLKEAYQNPFNGGDAVENSGNFQGAGVDLGYKFRIRHFCVELAAGVTRGTAKNFDEFNSALIPSSYVRLRNQEADRFRLGLSVGYAFSSSKE